MPFAHVPVRASTSRVCSHRASNWMCGTSVASVRFGLTGETTLRTQMFWWALWTLSPCLTGCYDLSIFNSTSAGTSHSVPQLSYSVPVTLPLFLSKKSRFVLESALSYRWKLYINWTHLTLNSTTSYSLKLVDDEDKDRLPTQEWNMTLQFI